MRWDCSARDPGSAAESWWLEHSCKNMCQGKKDDGSGGGEQFSCRDRLTTLELASVGNQAKQKNCDSVAHVVLLECNYLTRTLGQRNGIRSCHPRSNGSVQQVVEVAHSCA